MLKIRLQRLGRKKRPVYRVVVAEHSIRVKGRYVEVLGHYDPFMKEDAFRIDEEKMKLWIAKGAKPSDTVARLSKKLGIQGMDGYVIAMADRKKKNPTEEEVAAAAPAPEVVAEEKPIEEATPETVAEEPKAEEKEEKEEESIPEAAEEPAANETPKDEAPTSEKEEEVKEDQPA